jgi:hypothetical protein
MIFCGDDGGFLGTGVFVSDNFKAVKACACRGSFFDAIDANLAYAFTQKCQTQPNSDPQDFLCEIGGEAVYNRYGVTACGYNPFNTVESQKEDAAQALKNQQNNSLMKVVYGVVMLIAIMMILFLFKEKD